MIVGPDDNKDDFLVNEDSSLNKFRWRLFNSNEREVATITQRFDVPDIIAKIICARNVPFENIENYLNPQIKKLLPSPFILKDMDKAVERIVYAIKKGETIGVFGDYDVDGATASSIIYKFLRDVGVKNVYIHIPDRQSEGYGLNSVGLKELRDKGATLVIAVDCGITGFDAVDMANQMDLDIVIADHHEAEVGVPNAVAVIDPKRIDDDSGLNYLAACGVVFLMDVALNKTLRESGYYLEKGIEEPDLFSYLDLVALGTVCDVVPLVGANRAFVSVGVKVMAKRQNVGLKALCDISGISTSPTVYHLGYILGPRINAGGRVGNSALGADLLTTRNPLTADNLATRLNNFNIERKDIEASVLAEAFEKVASEIKPDDNFVFISGHNWHTGVIGIIAGRIKERYNLPTLVATIDDNGIANGSGRSIPEIDLGSAIIKAKEMEILSEGGGHSMAAGFTLAQDKIPEFKNFLHEYIENSTKSQKIIPVLNIDSVIDITGINNELIKRLSILEPFGTANEEPRFAVLNAKLTGADALSGGHIRCYFASDNGKSISAICYKAIDTNMGEALLDGVGKYFKLAGKIRANEWNGKRYIQFIIDDVAKE
ncbi:MAG: single-stranded-DNA-specific exonuclease RecJ [Alphaproteobacteria bacterium]|nr:single-stranded-DNA-specific exonuclease RecJ [Alphaproteobacteria bacterium]